jgi:hypothetical protein
MSGKTQNTKHQTLDKFALLRMYHLYHFSTFYQTKLKPLPGRWLLFLAAGSWLLVTHWLLASGSWRLAKPIHATFRKSECPAVRE